MSDRETDLEKSAPGGADAGGSDAGEADFEAPRVVRPQGSIDRASCSNGMIRIVGWMFWSESDPRPARITLRSATQPSKRLPFEVFPDARPDVNEHLGIAKGIATGFAGRLALDTVALAELPTGTVEIEASDPLDEFEPRVIGRLSVTLPEAPFQVAPRDESAEVSKAPSAPARGGLRRLWGGSVGRDEELVSLVSNDAPDAATLLDAFARLDAGVDVGARAAQAGALGLATRMRSASGNGGLIVIMDHDYGGGANTFSRRVVSRHVDGGNAVLRVWHDVGTGAYSARFTTGAEEVDLAVGSSNTLFRLLAALPSAAILLNSLWTYPSTYGVLDNLLRLRLYGYTQRLEFFAHDHMAVCPSLFLLNWRGEFCGVPEDLSVCRVCLKKSRLDFKSYYPQTDIAAWRASWQSLLINCDLIRFFSDDTHRNFSDAYPWLSDNPNVVVEGHEVHDIWPLDYRRDVAVAAKGGRGGLRIGVFGFISEHKGSLVLKSISDAILAGNDDTRIHVFGSLEGRTYGRVGAIDIHGPYAPVDMRDLCEDYGIDIAFTPSICPETFSFSTKELTLAGVPVASFNFGGQGDIVGRYEHGHLLLRGSGEALLAQFKEIAAEGFMRRTREPLTEHAGV